jgi:hypothetical protein
MRRAKVEGEAKKAAAREARRRARGSGSGAGRKGKIVGTPKTVRSPKAGETPGAKSTES